MTTTDPELVAKVRRTFADIAASRNALREAQGRFDALCDELTELRYANPGTYAAAELAASDQLRKERA